MIVAVAGGKGGVGKSTAALNLAAELDAVLVDADLTGADLPPGTGADLHDVLAGRADPVAATQRWGSIRLVPCGRTLAGARAATLEELEPAIDRLEREFDRVVIDCPAGLARDVGTVLACSDLCVLVTIPERPALVDGLRTARLATDLGTPVAAVAVNLVVGERHEAIADRLADHLRADVTTIDRDDAVAAAQSRWVPVAAYDPDAPAVEAYRSIADRLRRTADRLTARRGVG